MGGGAGGHFSGTRGSGKELFSGKSKKDALNSVSSYPETIQKSAKSFFKGSSNNYNNYNVTKYSDGTYKIKMENPGRVPGSKAIYYKEIDANGKTLRVYKETYDPQGNLVHIKEK